jgi:aryl-alcohol dehydrogenase-like predicted oxidoreductase
MIKRTLGSSGLEVSAIGLGCMGLREAYRALETLLGDGKVRAIEVSNLGAPGGMSVADEPLQRQLEPRPARGTRSGRPPTSTASTGSIHDRTVCSVSEPRTCGKR